ncbi:hypothetical protein LNKW23_34420 [Paralimibaculum aggregatum]|uniref:BPL/LPL catalytic domain-containing protein n=1 Tax=Paralimibaculum aggregatum TaxID=3036245 RepID=A0ABQ6LLZ5_9RHOB|nr:biotin/lipoate--protein ligase family protein [Limibaculum sp. NKW23]GMG84227.1 hypothetical protein LNKW23_34420 [Limibaculum sp. NKW23]
MTLAPGVPSFPPLLTGEETRPGQDPFAKAVARAAVGADPGLVVWADDPATARAAMVLAPEVSLAEAAGGAVALMLGLGDALGALAPPEVGVQIEWPATIRVNGARCGRIRAAASTADPAAEPDWMVVGFELDLIPPPDAVPGADPDRTWAHEEGCGEIAARALVESWSRHSLVWINTWTDRGFRPLHESWRGRLWRLGEALPEGGTFLGLDEAGGQLVKSGGGTVLRPLHSHLMEAS